MKSFPYYRQLDTMDCGPTCLRMIAKYYGQNYTIQYLRTESEIGKDGVSLLGIAQAAEQIGFKSLGIKVSIQKLMSEVPLPCIVHWGQNHFVVVYKINKTGKGKIQVADPASGLLTFSLEEFESRWATTMRDGEKCGVVLLLEPTQRFNERKENGKEVRGVSFNYLYSYLWRYRKLLVQLGLGLLVGSLLQLMLPFLTQSIVDVGVQTQNLQFIQLVLVAQLMLFVGRMSIEFIRSWILLHISTRLNLSILSDFLAKLLRLPLSYFDTKLTGDLLQRIGDHRRIETFLTGSSLNVLFSFFNLIVYGGILAYYHLTIFGVFLLGSIFYSSWVILFLRYRRELDHKRFALASQNQSTLIQLIAGVQEIKLQNAEHLKRWQWENLNVQQFKLSMKGLALGQYQQAGALFLNEGKNIFITFLAATAVVNGQLTLGGMIALQYIIGQMNSPVEQLVQFMQHWQDAQISLERLNEVYEMEDEHLGSMPNHFAPLLTPSMSHYDPGIDIKDLSFTYPGAGNEPVLRNINLSIPAGKVTAIVGSSGSGKTTLLKILLRFYKAQKGSISIPTEYGYSLDLSAVSHRTWRSQCGTVLQDGFIFSDTIANNIAVGDEIPNIRQLHHAISVANIQEFINGLPLGLNTKIGAEGSGISQGQRQRILIARAVYKNPDYIFFDEATNALDAENESIIMHNLDEFFSGRTVVVVAHRLSTVRNADQIVVLEKGQIIEIGTHNELVQQRGRYLELVSNQLELSL